MSKPENGGGSFDELLKSLGEVVDQTETLAKAAPTAGADDAAVAAAAADSGVAAGDPDEDDDEVPAEGAGDEPMAKSEGASGDDMVDATDLLKSMMSRLDRGDDVLAKALTGFTTVVAKQNDMIKSLQSQVQALGSQGRGRKAMISVSEKPPIGDMAKSAAAEEGKISHSELLAKSSAAFAAGKITGVEANTVDVCLRNGWSIDASVLTKIANA